MRASYLLFLLSLVLSACASVPQTDELRLHPGSLPPSFQVKEVPFISQSENFCGPASLSMLAHFAGLSPGLEELGHMMYTPAKRGSFPSDFLGAARRLGLLATPVDRLKNLLLELSGGHPVAVLLNFGSAANPVWHYAVAIAYNLKEEMLQFHSGREETLTLDFAQFERAWAKAAHWAMVAVTPSELPLSASVREILLAGSALERVGKTKEAILAYSAILKKWPEESSAYFGLGNAQANVQNWKAAAQALEHAVKLAPEEGAIWNNLGEVYQKMGKKKKADEAYSRSRPRINAFPTK